MLISYHRGQGSIILRVKIRNSSVSTGAGLTGLTNASTGLVISTIGNNEATPTAYTVAASKVETITTLGTYAAPTATKCRFKEVDATNHPGIYELQLADARYAVSGAKALLVSISGATNAADCDVLIPLLDVDPYDAVRFGLSAVPNAAAGATGGLPVRDANGNIGAALGNVAHGGAAATLAMKTVVVDNTGGSGHAVQVLAATGNGIRVTSSASPAVYAQGGTNSEGLSLLGNGTAAGLRIENAGTQSGILILAGANTGSNADGITAVPNGTGAGFSGTLSADAADSLLDNANGVETGWTLRQVLRLLAAAMAGKSSNNGNTFRDLNDTKDRIVGTVDASENRTAVTKDAT